MTDPVKELLEEAYEKLNIACREYRFERNDETEFKDHELYEIEWKLMKPIDKFIAECES